MNRPVAALMFARGRPNDPIANSLMDEHTSSTLAIPESTDVPRHIAIIMDGNGRWATQRRLPRFAGHIKGVEAVRRTVEAAARRGVKYLTLFAFSSENWRRPPDEVSMLMRLFTTVLKREVRALHDGGVRLRVIGDLSRFDSDLQENIRRAEERTGANTGLTLTIAANYGGRWDILQAMGKLLAARPDLATNAEAIDESMLAPHLCLSFAPEPDLFIRTGGEQRISNFLLWQLAYTELLFSDEYWPDFDERSLDQAIESFKARERRFGRTSGQVAQA